MEKQVKRLRKLYRLVQVRYRCIAWNVEDFRTVVDTRLHSEFPSAGGRLNKRRLAPDHGRLQGD